MRTGGAVRFDGVWKKFRRGPHHNSLRDLIPALARSWARAARPGAAPVPRPQVELEEGEFWALRDVSFEVGPGEALGIIGPNGAGKSTVLKLLTRILRPSRGEAMVRGRVAALLEIGGSLHPDLTGRENVYLQGSIMGMRHAEIARRFDEIVEFSGIPEFLDTPVRHYSSGMTARLGFSVAAHLEADVLIIDEVLAVGDSAFQRKAFERMETMVASGVPTVLVSHQLERVASLCGQALLLAQGRVVQHGTPAECIAAYANLQAGVADEDADDRPDRMRLGSVTLEDPRPVPSGGRIRLRIAGHAPIGVPGPAPVVVVRVRSMQSGNLVFGTNTDTHGVEVPGGPFQLMVELTMNVAPGIYSIECARGRRRPSDDGASEGPTAIVQVSGGPSFSGSVQMLARMGVTGATDEARD